MGKLTHLWLMRSYPKMVSSLQLPLSHLSHDTDVDLELIMFKVMVVYSPCCTKVSLSCHIRRIQSEL